MLKITEINKTYSNGVKALNKVSLEIKTGMFGLLGPNGSGKSTLMRTLATLQNLDSGTIFFNETNILKEKEKMRAMQGYLPQEFGLYPKVSAENLLHHLSILKGLIDKKQRSKMVDALLEITNLDIHRKKKLGTFSGGMKQRFGIAQALIGNPKILILDEPTAGLDPLEKDRLLNLLCNLGEKKLVILSTHIVSDVSELCDEMAIIKNGEILLKASPHEAIKNLDGKIWKIFISKSEQESYLEKFKVVSSKLFQGKIMLRIFSKTQPNQNFELAMPNLEDVYFSQIHGFYRDGV